jgi:hypothetical protein
MKEHARTSSRQIGPIILSSLDPQAESSSLKKSITQALEELDTSPVHSHLPATSFERLYIPMTERYKDFGTGSEPVAELEPITFSVAGRKFECRPSIPGALLLRFAADSDSDDAGVSSNALLNFLTTVIVSDQRDEFAALLEDPDVAISLETLIEISAWLIGQYTDRPTKEQSDSPSTPSKSGRTSTAERSSTGSTSKD